MTFAHALGALLILQAAALSPAAATGERPQQAADQGDPAVRPQPDRKPAPRTQQSAPPVLSFPNCKAAKAAGFSRIKRGDPGYSSNLDRDGDGIACD